MTKRLLTIIIEYKNLTKSKILGNLKTYKTMMKHLKNTKYLVVFLAGILFSAFTAFAATVTVNTDFTQNAVQYLQQLVLSDASGNT